MDDALPHPVGDLMAYLAASPTPYHAVAEAAARLEAAGFAHLDRAVGWSEAPDRGFTTRGGALVAWSAPEEAGPATPFRVVGAHTDSPNLRVKPQPDQHHAGWRQLGVEVYGGALVNSWLDRDLGLAGRVVVHGDAGPEVRLVHMNRPLLHIPQLAIHLDRDVWDKGLLLNRQVHLTPVWGAGPAEHGAFVRLLAAELGVDETAVASWDVMAHDLCPPALVGHDGDLLSSARLDNQCSCWCAVDALRSAQPRAAVGVVALFDHEEVGSQSATGADGDLLPHVLERLVLTRGGDRAAYLAALAGSQGLSADMAHATHPNYPERHDPEHLVLVNAGPVVKINQNQRYATDAVTQATFEQACVEAGVPVQRFVSRNDVPCGSTIGPPTSARLGIPTADVGVAMLAMHSARELCGAHDPALMARAIEAWFA